MTFQEKYSELYSNYERAGRELEYAAKKLSETNGFGDTNDISAYFNSHKNFSYHEKQFQQILNFANDGNINPTTEFVEQQFMYEIIKKDQIKKKNWAEGEENQFFTCEVGLTNDPEIKEDYQSSQYKFPVLNLNHGKECYAYLVDRLEFPPSESHVSTFDFSNIINESEPIFVKISMRSK
ncbi:hypothetical protein [Flavobacterium gelatinilyticum]|uniref:hypothetical protein n=1 Tax=Flavobacterium gelatinilyticum TaxID=3003260 RepID=UPI0024805CAF|nr:hypothetical protein [Flavobacterium gelatinilyticum]